MSREGRDGPQRDEAGARCAVNIQYADAGPTGVEGAGGTGGPGCGARGRWWGLAGQRVDAPSHQSVHQAPQVWRAPEGLEGLAAVPVGGGGAWPDNESTRRATNQYTRHHRCGGRRRDWRAWLRCPWAVAGPGRASSRRAEPLGSRRGRRAGGPPPTGTQSSPAQQGTQSSPAQQGTQSSPAQQAVGPDSARNTSGLRCNGVPTAALPGPS